jgi:hypothetical protein
VLNTVLHACTGLMQKFEDNLEYCWVKDLLPNAFNGSHPSLPLPCLHLFMWTPCRHVESVLKSSLDTKNVFFSTVILKIYFLLLITFVSAKYELKSVFFIVFTVSAAKSLESTLQLYPSTSCLTYHSVTQSYACLYSISEVGPELSSVWSFYMTSQLLNW